MRAVIQRVSEASVAVDGVIFSQIDAGLLIFLGIEHNDVKDDSLWLSNKIANLRIFSDKEGKRNNSILDIDGEIIIVSQFTLHASTKKGNRPSYLNAARSEQAISLYKQFKRDLSQFTNKGIFRKVWKRYESFLSK
jgi:D-tyrosyl-tRNA(Tyr) deacylase